MVATAPSFFRQRAYLAVALTHFCVDVLNSSRTLLVAILAVNIGLTNAQVGIALLVYNIGNAVSQPFFGWLADRVGPRWLVIGGIGWMIFFFSLAALVGDWPALIALTIAGLGSGMFHPTGTSVATQVSDDVRTSATAVFFMMGQLGLFAGPILAGFLLDQLDRPGYLVLPVLSLIAFMLSWQWVLNKPQATPAKTAVVPATDITSQTAVSFNWQLVGLFAFVIILSGSTSITAINFAPKLFTESGFSPSYVGILSGLFMAGSALGNLSGGFLGDRIPKKNVLLLAMLGSVLPVYFYVTQSGILLPALIMLSGYFMGMPHSILVIAIQSLLPNRRAFASGLALGFMFFSGSVGSYFLGLLADQIGLIETLQFTAVLPFLAAIAILFLPPKLS